MTSQTPIATVDLTKIHATIIAADRLRQCAFDFLRTNHIKVVSTDHCPFCFNDQKKLGIDDFTKIPDVGPGVENRLQLVHYTA